MFILSIQNKNSAINAHLPFIFDFFCHNNSIFSVFYINCSSLILDSLLVMGLGRIGVKLGAKHVHTKS